MRYLQPRENIFHYERLINKVHNNIEKISIRTTYQNYTQKLQKLEKDYSKDEYHALLNAMKTAASQFKINEKGMVTNYLLIEGAHHSKILFLFHNILDDCHLWSYPAVINQATWLSPIL